MNYLKVSSAGVCGERAKEINSRLKESTSSLKNVLKALKDMAKIKITKSGQK